MKKYLFLASAALALASCSSDDFIGNTPGSEPQANSTAINFDGGTGKITRATSNTGTTAQMLDGQFKVYGVKSGSTEGSNIQKVFVNYSVWDATNNSTTSNTKGWEYVGESNETKLGTGNITLAADQTIKYWDYSAADYRFVAGSPIKSFKYYLGSKDTEGETENSIKSATITGLAGHINANAEGEAIVANPIYVADPIIVKKANGYNKPITFQFVRQQAMVRVGIYETIPGYKITDIHFYEYKKPTNSDNQGDISQEATETYVASEGKNIILNSATTDYFVGATNASATINYSWDETPSYTFTYSDDGLTKSQNWYAGALKDGVKAATSNHKTVADFYGEDKDMDTKGYFPVLPTPETKEAAPILIKCDYTLTSEDGSGETIKVTGATAAIPAAFSKWAANTQYTYIFKISENTNGTTGNTENDRAGLFPITFDAAVKDASSMTEGTISTVNMPTITTYQPGSVKDTGIEYTAGSPIYATVTDDKGATKTLTTADVQVYKLSQARNEADLQIASIAKTELAVSNKYTTDIPKNDIVIGSSKLSTDNYLSFTPDKEDTYYAIQYLVQAASEENKTEAVYTYKVVYVKNAAPKNTESQE